MPMNDADIEARKAAAKIESDNAFEEWLACDNTKLLVSLVPQTEHPEVLKTLLRSAFHSGEGHATMSMFKSIFTAGPRREGGNEQRPTDFTRGLR